MADAQLEEVSGDKNKVKLYGKPADRQQMAPPLVPGVEFCKSRLLVVISEY